MRFVKIGSHSFFKLLILLFFIFSTIKAVPSIDDEIAHEIQIQLIRVKQSPATTPMQTFTDILRNLIDQKQLSDARFQVLAGELVAEAQRATFIKLYKSFLAENTGELDLEKQKKKFQKEARIQVLEAFINELNREDFASDVRLLVFKNQIEKELIELGVDRTATTLPWYKRFWNNKKLVVGTAIGSAGLIAAIAYFLKKRAEGFGEPLPDIDIPDEPKPSVSNIPVPPGEPGINGQPPRSPANPLPSNDQEKIKDIQRILLLKPDVSENEKVAEINRKYQLNLTKADLDKFTAALTEVSPLKTLNSIFSQFKTVQSPVMNPIGGNQPPIGPAPLPQPLPQNLPQQPRNRGRRSGAPGQLPQNRPASTAADNLKRQEIKKILYDNDWTSEVRFRHLKQVYGIDIDPTWRAEFGNAILTDADLTTAIEMYSKQPGQPSASNRPAGLQPINQPSSVNQNPQVTSQEQEKINSIVLSFYNQYRKDLIPLAVDCLDLGEAGRKKLKETLSDQGQNVEHLDFIFDRAREIENIWKLPQTEREKKLIDLANGIITPLVTLMGLIDPDGNPVDGAAMIYQISSQIRARLLKELGLDLASIGLGVANDQKTGEKTLKLFEKTFEQLAETPLINNKLPIMKNTLYTNFQTFIPNAQLNQFFIEVANQGVITQIKKFYKLHALSLSNISEKLGNPENYKTSYTQIVNWLQAVRVALDVGKGVVDVRAQLLTDPSLHPFDKDLITMIAAYEGEKRDKPLDLDEAGQVTIENYNRVKMLYEDLLGEPFTPLKRIVDENARRVQRNAEQEQRKLAEAKQKKEIARTRFSEAIKKVITKNKEDAKKRLGGGAVALTPEQMHKQRAAALSRSAGPNPARISQQAPDEAALQAQREAAEQAQRAEELRQAQIEAENVQRAREAQAKKEEDERRQLDVQRRADAVEEARRAREQQQKAEEERIKRVQAAAQAEEARLKNEAEKKLKIKELERQFGTAMNAEEYDTALRVYDELTGLGSQPKTAKNRILQLKTQKERRNPN